MENNLFYLRHGFHEYDTLNQLTRENNQAAGKSWVWTYDTGGNITSRKEYNYATGELGDPVSTVNYTYGDSAWGDLLTAYNGTEISHDEIGNPLNDGTWSYSWDGRQLNSMTGGTIAWSCKYDADGLRTERSDGATTYKYVYGGSSLAYMSVGSNLLYFTYDGSTPMTVTYNGTVYYYVTNLQGDVIAILDGSGNPVVQYTYDAWGRPLTTTGTLAETLGQHNPLRYRGYVYDTETGLYYVSSRYYDPEIGRWVNADNVLAGVGISLQGYNMFAYCFNNPVNMIDSTGNWPNLIKLKPDDIENFFESVQELILGASISFATDHELNRRPFRGEPGSVFVAPNGDKRGYGADGLPEWDYDHSDHGEKNKPRDKNGGHYHDWDHTKEKPRGDAYAITGIGIVGGIMLILEYLFMYSVC